MSIVISLPPDEEAQLQRIAGEQGQTAEDFVLQQIRPLLASVAPAADDADLPEIWRGLVGALHSGKNSLSQDTGRQFTEGMAQKRQEGHL